MSQHIVSLTSEISGDSVWIQLGWDKPMSEFYMVVFENVPDASYYDEGRVIYSNDLDPNGSGQDLTYLKGIATKLGCVIPQSLWEAATDDKALNAVNRTIFYSETGEQIESPWPESD